MSAPPAVEYNNPARCLRYRLTYKDWKSCKRQFTGLATGSTIGGIREKKSAWAKRKSASEASRELLWEVERVAAISPSTADHRLARFARQYFSYLTPFFALGSLRSTISGSLRNDDGDGYESVSYLKWICAASNLIALIPSRLICQMLANCFGVEF